MSALDERCRVVITGVGVVDSAFSGGSAALGAYLARPRSHAEALASSAPTGTVEGVDTRRLSRVCQLAVAAARLAVSDAACPSDETLGVVVGTEFGDLRSTREFAQGYLARGQAGLSALLFPNTVMNTMAAATAIVLQARALSLTINAPTVSGELAIARAAALIAALRAERLLAGGVDEMDPFVGEVLGQLGVDLGVRGEGAGFLVLESWEVARARGARVLGEILGAVSGALPARRHGVGRPGPSPAVTEALARAGLDGGEVAWVYASANGDGPRDDWERALLNQALAPHRPPVTTLGMLCGHHAGMGAMRVAAAAWTARSGLLPLVSATGAGSSSVEVTRVPPEAGLVHSVARGGNQVAIVVGPPREA
jgi:3-oxoacyl-[acyl-carrier-protein] synthase II